MCRVCRANQSAYSAIAWYCCCLRYISKRQGSHCVEISKNICRQVITWMHCERHEGEGTVERTVSVHFPFRADPDCRASSCVGYKQSSPPWLDTLVSRLTLLQPPAGVACCVSSLGNVHPGWHWGRGAPGSVRRERELGLNPSCTAPSPLPPSAGSRIPSQRKPDHRPADCPARQRRQPHALAANARSGSGGAPRGGVATLRPERPLAARHWLLCLDAAFHHQSSAPPALNPQTPPATCCSTCCTRW